MSEESWLDDVLTETETEISSWPNWLKQSAKKSKQGQSEDTSEDSSDCEELDQKVG
jgi:hypothetical protein